MRLDWRIRIQLALFTVIALTAAGLGAAAFGIGTGLIVRRARRSWR